MASVEITDNTIIRSLVRKGTNGERRQITLEEGELGYTTDTKRLFVGDGIGTGVTAGTKYLGVVNDWPASFAPQPGDFFVKDGGLYARKNNLSETDNISTLSGYDVIGLAVQPGDGLVNNNSSLDILVDNSTITFTFDNKLQVGTLTYNDLPTSESFMLLGNSNNTEKVPEEIQVNSNSVLGRISTGNIQSVTFDQILSNTVAPDVPSLKVTGLADNTSTRPIYVSSDGQITTTASNTQKNISCTQGENGIFVMSNGYPPNILNYNISNISDPISSGTSLDYLGFGYGFQLNVTYSICTVNIDNIRTVTGNSSLTWDEIDEFHFQFCSVNSETRCGFFGYRNQISNQNVILDFDLRSTNKGQMDTRSNFGYHIIPNTGSDLQFHVGLRGSAGFQASLVSVKLKY